MDFTTIVLVLIVAAVAYTLFKSYSKKETIAEAVKEEVAEVKAVEAKVEAEVKVVAEKAKATVQKATTKAKVAAKSASTKAKKIAK